jgi:hypothetical protein
MIEQPPESGPDPCDDVCMYLIMYAIGTFHIRPSPKVTRKYLAKIDVAVMTTLIHAVRPQWDPERQGPLGQL